MLNKQKKIINYCKSLYRREATIFFFFIENKLKDKKIKYAVN